PNLVAQSVAREKVNREEGDAQEKADDCELGHVPAGKVSHVPPGEIGHVPAGEVDGEDDGEDV
ncbi:unnamed protein product, partial [Cochlearia groenlandica]